MVSKDLKNKFFDIHKLPPHKGILAFPISMSRISNSQNATKCWEYMKIFSPEKVVKPLIGINFIYGDYLYFNSDEKASVLKKKFLPLILSHKNAFLKILQRHLFYIEQGFSFNTWNQILLDCKDYTNLSGNLKKFYEQDRKFQEYLNEDLRKTGKKKLDENQLNFFLEETLLFYLLTKGKIRLRNDYIRDHEKWVLWCYPGKPLKSQVYLCQSNPFKFHNEKNRFENCFYDLDERKLYDFSKIDLDTVNL